MAESLTRRKFNRIIGAAGVAGTALLNAMCAEVEEEGALSDESVRAFLAFTDQELDEEKIQGVKESLESTLENLRKVRALEVGQWVEPATTFRARR